MGNHFRAYMLFAALLSLSTISNAQKIINAVWVGNHGVTDKIDSAKFLILVRYLSDTAYQRVEYNLTGPMIKLISYKDPAMTIKHGPYYEYDREGWIKQSGNYKGNKKNGEWYEYGDSSEFKTESKYIDDSLIYLKDIEPAPKNAPRAPGEIEAEFPGGINAYKKYISKHFSMPERAEVIHKAGTLYLLYVVDVDGSARSSFLAKSIELSLDDEAIRLINSLPKWSPATKNGEPVKTFFKQPLSFEFE